MVVKENRKEQIIDVAVSIFAKFGYYKTTTSQVAKAVGVTQPYVFHFFKNKGELFMAVIDRAFLRIYYAFSEVEACDTQLMHVMGKTYMHILQTHRSELTMVMQAHSIAEPVIREHVREKFRMIYVFLTERLQKAGYQNAEAEANQFIAMGLLITVSQVLELPELIQFLEM